jgi:type IV secretion system protein VirB4
MPPRLRRFSTVRQNLPKTGDNSLYERLGRWCQGGALGWVFDEADDRLTDLHEATAIGFDTTEFLDLPEVRTPIMMYLLDVMDELVERRTADLRDLRVLEGARQRHLQRLRQAEAKDDQEAERPGHLRHPKPFGRAPASDRPNDGRAKRHQDLPGELGSAARGVRRRIRAERAEYEIVRSLGARGGRAFMVKQGDSSAVCELDLTGLEDAVTVLSATTDNVALLGPDPRRPRRRPLRSGLPLLLDAVHSRKTITQRRAA